MKPLKLYQMIHKSKNHKIVILPLFIFTFLSISNCFKILETTTLVVPSSFASR